MKEFFYVLCLGPALILLLSSLKWFGLAWRDGITKLGSTTLLLG